MVWFWKPVVFKSCFFAVSAEMQKPAFFKDFVIQPKRKIHCFLRILRFSRNAKL